MAFSSIQSTGNLLPIKSNIKSQCHAEIKQDLEGNWWCSLSVTAMNWTPANRQEANHRHFQILELQSLLQKRLRSAPAFRYAFIGEVGEDDLNYLLTDSDNDYTATYDRLVSSRSSNQFTIPVFGSVNSFVSGINLFG